MIVNRFIGSLQIKSIVTVRFCASTPDAYLIFFYNRLWSQPNATCKSPSPFANSTN